MGFTDPVVWGSIAAVIIAIVVFVFLIFKIKTLMDKDAESHRK